LLRTLWAILCLVVALPAAAVEMATLYTAEVALDPQADDARALAYRSALDEVLLRVSGSELVADRELVELLFPDPAAYVVQYRPGGDDTLWVSFDGGAVERALREAGQTVWGSDRPLTLIWLAVDWGGGEREIVGADDPDRGHDAARSIDRNRLLRERVLDVARRRGLPVAFPLLDSEDLQRVSFSDIWGGFDDAVLEASERYDANSVLVGRIRPGSAQRNVWRYHFGSRDRTWTGEPEAVLGYVADLLAGEFAISGNARVETVDLTVSGIDSVEAYGSVQSLLAGLSVIEDFSIAEVRGDRIRYRVDALGGADRLGRALRFNGLIEQNAPEGNGLSIDPPAAGLEFYYSP
jgi:hypothetical protein